MYMVIGCGCLCSRRSDYKKEVIKRMFIPDKMQCFWCNELMRVGTTKIGSGDNYVTYWCQDCGSVAHFCVNRDNRIKKLAIEYKHEREENT